MNRWVMEQLVGTQFCGAELPDGKLCLLWPEHKGDHSPLFSRSRLTPTERRERKQAHLRGRLMHANRRIAHLTAQLRAEQRKRARVEAYRGYRIEYRLRGLVHRWRRWRWQAWRRLGWT